MTGRIELKLNAIKYFHATDKQTNRLGNFVATLSVSVSVSVLVAVPVFLLSFFLPQSQAHCVNVSECFLRLRACQQFDRHSSTNGECFFFCFIFLLLPPVTARLSHTQSLWSRSRSWSPSPRHSHTCSCSYHSLLAVCLVRIIDFVGPVSV